MSNPPLSSLTIARIRPRLALLAVGLTVALGSAFAQTTTSTWAGDSSPYTPLATGYFAPSQWVDNWVNQFGPQATFDNNLVFPASATGKEVTFNHQFGTKVGDTVTIADGYDFNPGWEQRGWLMPSNGGTIEFSGSSTFDLIVRTENSWGDVTFRQADAGTLTLGNGSGGWPGLPRTAGFTFDPANAAARIDITETNGVHFKTNETLSFTGTGLTTVVAGAVLPAPDNANLDKGVRVMGGNLVVDGTLDQDVAAAAVSVYQNGRLMGNGTVSTGGTTFIGSFNGNGSTGRISPGDPEAVGTLTLAGDLTFSEHGAYGVDLDGAANGDLLVVNGDVDLGNAALLVSGNASGDYTILTYTGTRTGTFREVDLPAGYTVDYSTPGQIDLIAGTAPVANDNFVFPAGAVIDLTQEPYWPSGWAADQQGTDVTAALEEALDTYDGRNLILYLPDGHYRVTDTVKWDGDGLIPSGGQESEITLQGQSRDGVVLFIPDSHPNFGDPQNSRPILSTGTGTANAFRNSVRNLTIDAGSGNPGAIGLFFNANNQGSVRDVRIVSQDGQGVTGLDLGHAQNGPLYLRNLVVEGFGTGIATAFDDKNSQTLEHITLIGQGDTGLDNNGQVLTVRGLRVIDVPNPVRNGSSPFSGSADKGSMLVLLDSVFQKGADQPFQGFGIQGTASVYLRNVAQIGYERLYSLQDSNGNTFFSLEAHIDEAAFNYRPETSPDVWTLGDPTDPDDPLFTVFPSVEGGLGLPVEEPPVVPWETDLTKWITPNGIPDDPTVDNTAAIQAAIDTPGKTTLYIPQSEHLYFSGTVYLRGDIERVIGTDGWLDGGGSFVVQDGTADTVVIERFRRPIGGEIDLRVETDRTVVISSVQGWPLTVNGTGKVFVDDATINFTFLNPNQQTWLRSVNVEDPNNTNVSNFGADLWILGLKTERGSTKIGTYNGGRTEMLGMFLFENGAGGGGIWDPNANPAYEVDESQFFIAGMASTNTSATPFDRIVREVRDGSVSELARSPLPARTSGGAGIVLPAFSGHDGQPDIYHYEVGGQVDIEAERWSARADGVNAAAGSAWDPFSDADAQAGVAMVAEPDNGVDTGDATDGARLDFDVDFVTPGTYYVWVRLKGSAGSGSVHVGLDGSLASGGGSGMGDDSGAWHWEHWVDRGGNDGVTVNVPAAGIHTVNLWMREDGTEVDAIILTTDSNLNLDGNNGQSPFGGGSGGSGGGGGGDGGDGGGSGGGGDGPGDEGGGDGPGDEG
ncbi:MAG: glycosyl hydrolase family 28-related protein [Opitutales bacterium]